MLIAQTTPVFDYDLAVRLGLQKGADQITEFGVQTIRAFCVSDTVVFIPLTVLALIGMLMKKRWALYATASTSGRQPRNCLQATQALMAGAYAIFHPPGGY